MEWDKKKMLWRATVVLGAASVGYLMKEYMRKKDFKEPGLALPGMGHLHMMNLRNMPWELERLRKYVKDKVMAVWLGPDYLVYVTTPQLTHKVFVEHGDKSSGRSAQMPKELEIGNKGLVLNEGPAWKKNRRLILRELIGSKERSEVVEEVFDELVDNLGKAADADARGQVPELGDLIHKTVASGMCMLIFGYRLPDELVEEILELVDYIGAKSFDYMFYIRLPFYKMFRFEIVLKFEYCCQRMVQIVDEIVKKRTEGRFKERGMTSIEHDMEESPYLSEVLFEAIQGGLDTTTAMVEWCCAYLAHTPDFQKRLHAEMDEKCHPSGPVIDDRHKLTLLNAAIMETLRMAQISSLVVPHKATEPIDIGKDYAEIPKGATLLWSFNELHGDEKLWGDPWVFRPDRFLVDFPGLDPNPNKDLTAEGEFKKFMPFGIGPRHCPGYKLATYELFVGLSKLLWTYEFSSEEEIDLSHYTESIPVRVRGFVPTVRRRKRNTSFSH